MNKPELTLEQQFALKMFEEKVSKLTREQAQEFLVLLFAEHLGMQNTYKALIKQSWGLVGHTLCDF